MNEPITLSGPDWAKGLTTVADLGYNTGVNHIKSGQVLLAPAHPFSTYVRGVDTMSDITLPLFSLQPQTREIPLTQGKVAIVDASDYDELSRHEWCAVPRKQTWYAMRNQIVNGKSVCHYMHRDITGVAKGVKVDHKDGDGLNNTRDNLRPATNQQNSFNKRSVGGKSQYKGVTWCKFAGRWRARICRDGKVVNIGRFDHEEEAARAYDELARELYGEFAWLNFA